MRKINLKKGKIVEKTGWFHGFIYHAGGNKTYALIELDDGTIVHWPSDECQFDKPFSNKEKIDEISQAMSSASNEQKKPKSRMRKKEK